MTKLQTCLFMQTHGTSATARSIFQPILQQFT